MPQRHNPEMTERSVKMAPSLWRLVWIALDVYAPADMPLDEVGENRRQAAMDRIASAMGVTR